MVDCSIYILALFAVSLLVYVVAIIHVFVVQRFYQYDKRQYNQLYISQYTILQAVIIVT